MKWKNQRSILTVLGLLSCLILFPFICVLGFLAVSWGNSYYICFNTLTPSNADVEKSAYLQFPPSAQNIEFYANGINRKAGCTIWIKFEMDSKDLNELLKTTHIEDVSSLPNQLGDLAGGLHFFSTQGWNQTSLSLAGHGQPSWRSENQWIFIDTHDSEKWIVYFITNQEWL